MDLLNYLKDQSFRKLAEIIEDIKDNKHQDYKPDDNKIQIEIIKNLKNSIEQLRQLSKEPNEIKYFNKVEELCNIRLKTLEDFSLLMPDIQ